VPLAEVSANRHGAIFADPPILRGAGRPREARTGSTSATPRCCANSPSVAREGARASEVIGRPFRLVSRRMPNVYNSSGRDIACAHARAPYNPAFLHPDDSPRSAREATGCDRVDHARHSRPSRRAAPELRRGVL